jgi:hypothetical protein
MNLNTKLMKIVYLASCRVGKVERELSQVKVWGIPGACNVLIG